MSLKNVLQKKDTKKQYQLLYEEGFHVGIYDMEFNCLNKKLQTNI